MAVRVLAILLVAGSIGLLPACTKEQDKGKPIAKVNDYVITDDVFRKIVLSNTKIYGKDIVTQEDKKNYLDQAIQKELLVQEAIKRGLDKKAAFRDTIENFWEQTLISSLIKKQTMSLQDSCIVSEEELKQAYDEYKQRNPEAPPLEKIKNRLKNQLMEKKKRQALDKWLTNLKEQSHIEIYQDNLQGMQ